MSYNGWPSQVNHIVALGRVHGPEGEWIISADGRTVYRGKDEATVSRWKRYFDERTPWTEINAAEAEF